MTANLYDTHDDYLINFFLNLMKACSQTEDCPLIIIRILCNHLGWLSRDNKLKINEGHQKLALDNLEFLRAEIVFDFVKNLDLSSIVDEGYLCKLAQNQLKKGSVSEAANLIIKFNLHKQFDIKELIINLLDAHFNNLTTAKMLMNQLQDPDVSKEVVDRLSTYKNHKVATALLKDYNLKYEDFPKLKEIEENSSANYFIARAFIDPTDTEYMTIYKIEELFCGNKKMLIELCRVLLKRKYPHQAKGMYQRNNLYTHPRSKEIEEEI